MSSEQIESDQALLESIAGAAAQADATFKTRSGADWRSWLTRDIDQGARNVHAIVEGPTPWVPTTTLSRDGAI
eukprot:2885535-Pyramimonas_sp.AAC.1